MRMKLATVADLARQYLEERIIKGDFRPGQQIKEEEVASRLGISRPPIREAIKVLETEGLLTRRPRRGVVVSQIRQRDIWEVYTLKTALYELSIHLAFRKISTETLQRLEDTVAKMEDCVSKDPCNRLKYQKMHENFHNTIIDLAGNQRLKRIVSILHNQVKRISYASLADEAHLKESCRYHREILEALKRRDKGRVEELNREHILQGLKAAQRLIFHQDGVGESDVPFV